MYQNQAQLANREKHSWWPKGGVIQPSSQILLLNPDQWEDLILAAARMRPLPGRSPYAAVKRLGSAGDGGRDIEAWFDQALVRDRWDLYQAKHYAQGLAQSDAFPEMAKFFKQLALKTYPRPSYYYFCCPRAVGNELHNTMASGSKAKFLDAWKNEHTGMKGRVAELTRDVQAGCHASKALARSLFLKTKRCIRLQSAL